MDQGPSESPFTPGLFHGRKPEVQAILDSLRSATADKDRRRCIIIEGPSGQGKSWVLSMVDHLASTDRTLGLRTCLLTSKFLKARGVEPAKLICLVWRTLHDLIPEPLSPAALYGLPPDALTDELLAAHLTPDLNPTPLYRIQQALQQQEQPVYLTLIVDGMDELNPDLLGKLELEFISELFTVPQVRLLSARRIDSPNHMWRLSALRKQRMGFSDGDGPDVRSGIWQLGPLDPEAAILQIEDRRAASGIALSADELRAQIDTYEWRSPGVNKALIEAIARDHDGVTASAIERGLREIMNDPQLEPIGDQNFERLKLLVRRYNSQMKAGGLDDRAIEQHLRMLATGDRLLAELTKLRRARPRQAEQIHELEQHLAAVEQALTSPVRNGTQEAGAEAEMYDAVPFKERVDFEDDLLVRGIARKDTVFLVFSPTIVQLFEALLKLEIR